MNQRLQALVYGAVLALIVGWVLYIGKDVFVPIVFSILVVYVIVGITRLLSRIPVLGRILPLQLRYTLSVLVIAFGLFGIVHLFIANKDNAVALAPRYQQSLLAAIQGTAAYFGIENEPTWATLRQDLLARIDLQGLVGSTLASVSSIVASLVVVALFASFLLLEQRSFANKIAKLSDDPRNVARIREITNDINARIGSYLALKTFLSLLLGAICWMVMRFFGLEFAGLLAGLIALLNYVPYIGSFLGVLLPAAVAIVQFGDPREIVAILLSMSVAQAVIGNILDPYIMSNSLNLSPFAILVSLTVWSALWGIPGAFLAVPIAAMMAIVFSEFAGTRPIAVLLSRNGEV